MKEYWYAITMLLVLSILAGFSSMTAPTGAVIANLAPEWDSPTTEFHGKEQKINLDNLFFDPDGNELTYGAQPSKGINAGIQDNQLFILAEQSGTVTLVASDGSAATYKKIDIKID